MLGVICGSLDLNSSLRNECGKLLVVNRHQSMFEKQLPHEIDYVSLLSGMQARGVTEIVSFHTVGGIHPTLNAGDALLTTDVIDYTWGRKCLGGTDNPHLDAGDLFDQSLSLSIREILNQSERKSVVMGVTQGPRLETPAEIQRMARDGCHIVGMTAMPEAYIAKQLGIPYVSVALVVNKAAGYASAEELKPESMKMVGDRFKVTCSEIAVRLLR